MASVSGPGCHAAPGYVGALVYRNPRRIPTVSPLAGHGVVMAGGMMLQAKVPGRCATGGVGKRAARAADRTREAHRGLSVFDMVSGRREAPAMPASIQGR